MVRLDLMVTLRTCSMQYSTALSVYLLEMCVSFALCALSSQLAADSPPLCQNKCRNVCESGPINVIRQGLVWKC